MIAKIDDFVFDLNDEDIYSIDHRLNFGYQTSERIGNHPFLQSTGKWTEEVSFAGKLVMKSLTTFNDFETMAKLKKPARLTLGAGVSFKIVINSFSYTKSGFLKNGYHRYQEYSIVMTRYFQ